MSIFTDALSNMACISTLHPVPRHLHRREEKVKIPNPWSKITGDRDESQSKRRRVQRMEPQGTPGVQTAGGRRARERTRRERVGRSLETR